MLLYMTLFDFTQELHKKMHKAAKVLNKCANFKNKKKQERNYTFKLNYFC